MTCRAWPHLFLVMHDKTVPRVQGLLPGCNVAIMVQLQPQLFLGKTTKQLQSQVGTAYDIISRELPCEYVDAMVQVDSCTRAL